MVSKLSPTLRNLAEHQYGVVSRSQAIRAGLSPDMIKFRVRSGRWQQLHLGVYATFSGIPGRGAYLWAALLAAGPGAVLSYQTAAELHGLSDKPTRPIHVSVPRQRHLAAVEGVSLHRSARAIDAVQEGSRPPRTTVEETVLDLTQVARSFDDVCGWVTRAVARELTDEVSLKAAMAKRERLRWRADLHAVLTAAVTGDHSVLEYRYHRDVERAHGLPEPDRQVPFTTRDGRRGRRDRVYQEFGVVVELDGRLAHPAENKWKDKARDNAAAAGGQQSLRYDWTAVTQRACATAAEVAGVLRGHGWNGTPRPCSPGCPVQRDLPRAGTDATAARPRPGATGNAPVTAASTRLVSVRSGSTTCAPAEASSAAP
jgi:hypothetical protein